MPLPCPLSWAGAGCKGDEGESVSPSAGLAGEGDERKRLPAAPGQSPTFNSCHREANGAVSGFGLAAGELLVLTEPALPRGSRIRPRSAARGAREHQILSPSPQVDFQALSPVLELAGHRPGPCPVQVRAQAGLPLGTDPAPRAQRPALRQALLPIASALATAGRRGWLWGSAPPPLLLLSFPARGAFFPEVLSYFLILFYFCTWFLKFIFIGVLKGCSGSAPAPPWAPGIHLRGE